MARKVGEAWNAEQLVAARNLLVNSADSVFQKARKAKGGSDQDVLDFQQSVTRHMAIQAQVAGLTAEAGRALSSFRILAQQTKEARDLGQVIAEFGGRGNIDEIADMVSKFNSPQQVSKFLMDSRKATTGDMLV